MYLVITREENVGCACSCGSDTVDVFCTLLQKAGKVDPNELRKKWLDFKHPETVKKYLMDQPRVASNFTKQGKIRVNVFEKERKRRNVSFTTYLTTFEGFKKVNYKTATDYSYY
jgi:hypothetical protein